MEGTKAKVRLNDIVMDSAHGAVGVGSQQTSTHSTTITMINTQHCSSSNNSDATADATQPASITLQSSSACVPARNRIDKPTFEVKVKVKVNVCAHGGIAIQQTSAHSRILTRMEEQQPCNSDHHGGSTILVEQLL